MRGSLAVVDFSQAISGVVSEWSATSSNTNAAVVSVGEGGRAEIAPVSAGAALITVTAHNAGGVAETTFTVRVVPPGATAPATVAGALQPVTLSVGAGPVPVDLGDAFAPPGFTLTLRTLNPEIVTASVSGMTAILTPVSAGSGAIEITARNAAGSLTRTLLVTVVARPATTGNLEPLALVAGSAPTIIDLSTAFSPPTGLSYQAASDNEQIVTATVIGRELTVTPVAPGTAAITVTAHSAAGSATDSIPVVVAGENQAAAPAPVGTLPPLMLGTGSGPAFVDVGAAFTPRGFRLEARSLNPGVAAVTTHSDAALRVTPVGAGRTTIEVTAANSFGSGSRQLQVEVVGPPRASGTLHPVSLTIGALPEVVDLRNAFSPPGFEVSARSLNEGVLAVSVGVGPSVTLTPVAAGNTSVEVTAHNAGGSTTRTIPVTVAAAAPRAVGTFAPVSLSTGGAAVDVDVAAAFTPAGVPIEARALNTGVVTATVNGSVVTLTPVGDGGTSVEVTASNASGSANLSIAVTVAAAASETPRVVASYPTISLVVGGVTRRLDVQRLFTPVGVPFEARSLDTGVVTVEVDGSVVTFTAVGPGAASVEVTATNASGSATLTIRVTAAATAPEAVGSPDPVSLSVGGAAVEIDIADLFTPTGVSYTYGSANSGIVNAQLSGSILTLTPVTAGTTSVRIRARNALGEATQTIPVTVAGTEAPQAVGTLAPVSLAVGGEPAEVDVADAFTPAGLTMRAYSGREAVVTVAVNGTVITITPVGEGATTVYVDVSNASGTARQRMSVTVVADPTATVDLADVTLSVGGETVDVDVARAFVFPNPTVEASSRDTGVVTVEVNGTILTLTPVGVGRTTVSVTASHQDGASTKPFYVTVYPMAPQAVGTLEPVTLMDEGPAVEVDVANAFTPADVTISARYTGDERNIDVGVEGTVVTITPRRAGANAVQVTARNSAGSATQTFSVTILPVPPEAVGTVDAVELVDGGAPVQRYLWPAFEGQPRTLEVRSNDTGIVMVAVQDDRWIKFKPVGEGSTSVVVTARNAGGSASHTVSVAVTGEAPEVIATPNPETIRLGRVSSVAIHIASIFTPATVWVEAVSNDTEVATVEVTTTGSPDREPIVEVTPVGPGTTALVITGRTANGSASLIWEFTVLPPE